MRKTICHAPECTKMTCGGRYCSTHYKRLRVHGSIDLPSRASVADRFWAKVDQTAASCWLWTAACDYEGYGKFGVRAGKTVRAHRYAYETMCGPVPDGLVLDHLCRVRNCVNPAHLEPVTVRENVLRGIGTSARQARQTHCVRGHELPSVEAGARRICKECQHMWSAHYWAKRKREAAAS